MYTPRSIRSLSLLSCVALAACAAQPAFAQDQQPVRAGTVIDSQCSVVASSGGVAGEAIGGTVGAVGGAILGEVLFGGKSAQGIGAFLGGLGGSAAGEKIAQKHTYRCLLRVNVAGQNNGLYVETVGQKLYNVGASVILVKDVNGSWLVR